MPDLVCWTKTVSRAGARRHNRNVDAILNKMYRSNDAQVAHCFAEAVGRGANPNQYLQLWVSRCFFGSEFSLTCNLWRVPFDHLTCFAVHNFRSLSRLCRSPRSPLGLSKLARSHELPAPYTNHEVANTVIMPNIVR